MLDSSFELPSHNRQQQLRLPIIIKKPASRGELTGRKKAASK
jgi:hypothetical protein